ncbi:MAG: hypothetical protein JWP12_2878 [Bacteroidetes bacterium]|nr:hypothetical protein [Bacteroidota bacterium]
MATGNVIVTVVDVGQGQCTFVEIYDDDGMDPKLIHTLMVDCGSDKESSQTGMNLQYIADKVSTMDVPAFDCIVFSHSDKDHISLTKKVLDRFLPEKKPVVKLVWYGGAYDLYKKSGFNILDYLVKEGYCLDTDLNTTGSNFSGYNPGIKDYTSLLWEVPDHSVKLFPIISNTLSSDPDWDDQDLDVTGKTAEAKNRVSIICGLYYAGASYVICGDATNVTMAAVNQRFQGNSTVFGNNVMTTIPHHGSRSTGFAVKSGEQASLGSLMVVMGFSSLLKSKTISVSANQKHRHPSLYLMSTFIPTLKQPVIKDPRLKQKNTHLLTANIDYSLKITYPDTINIPMEQDLTFETRTNTFCTNYNVDKPTFSYELDHIFAEVAQGTEPVDEEINLFACWKYIAKSNGGFELEGYTNLSVAGILFTQAADLGLERDNMEFAGRIKPKSAIRLRPRQAAAATSSKSFYMNKIKQFH